MRRIRIWIASALTWVAAWIAPRPLRPIFLSYCMMLESFPRELASGRTYGVVVVPWTRGFSDSDKAQLMQNRAIEAASAARAKIDALLSPTDGAEPTTGNAGCGVSASERASPNPAPPKVRTP